MMCSAAPTRRHAESSASSCVAAGRAIADAMAGRGSSVAAMSSKACASLAWLAATLRPRRACSAFITRSRSASTLWTLTRWNVASPDHTSSPWSIVACRRS
jgi:hypothetical protein